MSGNGSPSDRVAVVVEDDPEVASLLEAILQQAGFTTHVAHDGQTGLDLIRTHDPVLTTLDVNLPGIDGFEVSRRIRTFSRTYIIMLSARQEEIDTLMGLDAGADDYLSKPFRPRELRARVEAMLRRRRLEHEDQELGSPTGPASAASASAAPTPASPVSAEAGDDEDADWVVHNGLRVHETMRLVELDGEPIALTRTEFDLLLAIVLRKRRVVSKNDLAEEIRPDLNGYVTEADRRTVETHLANLRRKLSDSVSTPRFIETVRGVGYRLTPKSASGS